MRGARRTLKQEDLLASFKPLTLVHKTPVSLSRYLSEATGGGTGVSDKDVSKDTSISQMKPSPSGLRNPQGHRGC